MRNGETAPEDVLPIVVIGNTITDPDEKKQALMDLGYDSNEAEWYIEQMIHPFILAPTYDCLNQNTGHD